MFPALLPPPAPRTGETAFGTSAGSPPLRSTLLALCTLAVCALALTACSDDDTIACGEGTTLEDGQCVPDALAPPSCGEGTTLRDGRCVRTEPPCGAGTVLRGDACVPDAEACGAGTTLDPDRRACVPDDQALCATGTAWDNAQNRCVPADGVSCGEGTRLDEDAGACVPLPADCPDGTVPDGDRCVIPDTICGEGTLRDPVSGRCVADTPTGPSDPCGPGTRPDPETGRCTPDPDACGEGTSFNPETGTCTPDVRCRPGDAVMDGICVPATDGLRAPMPTAPGHGARGLSTRTPLVWQLDPDLPRDATFTVQIARDASFQDLLGTFDAGRSFDFVPPGLTDDNTWSWRVRAEHSGQQGPFSTPRSFTTIADDDPRRAVVYQLVIRHFANTEGANLVDGTLEENGVGRFADIDDRAIAALRAKGATHIWLTGVLRQATGTDWSDLDPPLPPDDPDLLKGRAGSFFAVRDYFDVSPDYALDPDNRREEFRDLVDRIHDAGLQVLIDLVPNHVARSYASVVRPDLDLGLDDDQNMFFSPQNHFFWVQEDCALELPAGAWQFPGRDGTFPPEDGSPGRRVRVTGNNVISCTPSANDWYETVKLNYGYEFTTGLRQFDPIPPTWTFMDEVIRHWQEDFGVDGFRVDFAHFVPTEFYAWAIERARDRNPDALFIAEAYENLEGLLDAGFDAVYEDDTYDLLKGIYNGSHDKFELDNHLASIAPERRHQYVRYLENHDERRIASPLLMGVEPDDSGFGTADAGRHLAPVSYLVGNGPVLFHNAQSLGEEGAGVSGFSGDNGRTSIFDYWSVPTLARWARDGRFDGGALTPGERDLHEYYRRLLHLLQHPAATGDGYWGLDFHNRTEGSNYPDGVYAFARFAPGQQQLLVVAVNLTPDADTGATIRLPAALIEAAGLPEDVRVTRIFDETGNNTARPQGTLPRSALETTGIDVLIANQGNGVWLLD
ncbi:MAG: hypothetical protein EA398_05390 [Deltaproteobacteria bacterium]|nr:MAG: hypothetical protein EA398_05390 [Deltaproteobacteria bacterium]